MVEMGTPEALLENQESDYTQELLVSVTLQFSGEEKDDITR